MNEKLLVVADLGRIKAYRLQEDRHFSIPRLELLGDWETDVTHHLSKDVSDQAGQFRNGAGQAAGSSALSDGEQHNIDLERRRRAVKTLAHRINDLLEGDGFTECYLAADKRINQQLLEEMGAHTRAKIQKNVPVNLSRVGKEELLKHFCG